MDEELKKLKGVSVYEQNEFETAVLEANKEITICKDSKDIVQPIETEKERNIRLGKITPFGTALKIKSEEKNTDSAISRYLLNQQFLEYQKKESKKYSPVPSKTLRSETTKLLRTQRTKGATLSKKVIQQSSTDDSGSEYVPSDVSSEDDTRKSRSRKSIKNRKRKKSENLKPSSDNEESNSEYWNSSEDEVRYKKSNREKCESNARISNLTNANKRK